MGHQGHSRFQEMKQESQAEHFLKRRHAHWYPGEMGCEERLRALLLLLERQGPIHPLERRPAWRNLPPTVSRRGSASLALFSVSAAVSPPLPQVYYDSIGVM